MAKRTLTYFLQHSGAVLPDVERGAVTLQRRDGEDVDLMTHGQRSALETMLRVLAELATRGPEGATTVLPWLRFLDAGDRAACLAELVDTARVAVDTGRLDRLEQLIGAWRATGLAAWDEQVASEHAGPMQDEPVDLPRPGSR